jgi:phosphohistidine phosphatase SixA
MPHWKLPSLLVCLTVTVCACAGKPSRQQDLWNILAQGGYVLLMPHVSAAQSAPERTPASPARCNGHDLISERGRAQAQRLKQAIQDHAVAVVRVLTSSDCRCVQTAGILFGRAELWSILDTAGYSDTKMRRQKNAALREAISRWKSEGNLVLVSHPGTIRDALDVDIQPGEVLVIEPMGDAGYRVLGPLPLN